MLVDPKHLVRRLSASATHALEASVQNATASGHSEVGPEHLLVALLALDEGDLAILIRRLDIDRNAALRELRSALRTSDSSSRRRPVFAESLFRWLEDAWAPASLEFGSAAIRTGHLLLQLLTTPQRYLPELPRALAVVRASELRQHLAEWTAQSHERADADDPTTPHGPAAKADASELERFTHSLTKAAQSGTIDPICGRDAEIYQLIEVLARRRKNNPVIVGEPGVGKTALVEGLALAIVRGDVPPALAGVDLRTLDLGLLQAGAGVRGEFERRLHAVIDGVRASPTPIVLFIDEAHTLISPNHDHDAANLLKPALARGELRTIAATTWREFKKYFEKDPALERRFQPVRVDEPNLDAAAAMLRSIRGAYEKTHGVLILDAAIDAAVQLSHRYIQSRLLPDKAIDVLDTAAARVQLEQNARPSALAALEQQLAALDRQLAAYQREEREAYPVDHDRQGTLTAARADLADRATLLATRYRAERDALAAIQAARQALETDDGPSAREALQAARADLRALAGPFPLVHAEVDADAVARVVATMSGVPVERLHRSTVDALLHLEATLGERIKGQPYALQAIAEALRIARAGIHAPERPLGVFLFVGTSGVGKTETALALADLIFGGEQSLITINMSEFQAPHTTSRLVGSPPGYVGYGEGGTLTEAVRKRPYSVVLLDECEKAHPDVLNLFYQVFDKGTLADGEGRVVDFRNTIIILTSNLASDELLDLAAQGATPSEAAAAIRPILSAHFKPALLARKTVVPFMPLDRPTLQAIAELKLDALARRVHAQHDITATFAPELLDRLVDRCATVDAGARELDHILRASLMPRLGAALLTELIDGVPRRALTVDLTGDGEWHLEFH